MTLRIIRLKSVLPNGAVFPFDFGSIPATTADDGDPLVFLLLMDEPAFTGCLVRARLLGVIEAAQTSDGKTERNDRLIAVAAESYTHSSLKSLGMLDSELIKEIEHFLFPTTRSVGKSSNRSRARARMWRRVSSRNIRRERRSADTAWHTWGRTMLKFVGWNKPYSLIRPSFSSAVARI